MLEIQSNSPIPIYEQLIAGIKKMIQTGDLEKGESLPSIRALASTLDVAANTVARAYNELERDGYIKSYGVKGTFVNDSRADESMELSQLSHILRSLLKRGYTRDKILGIIELNINEISKS